MCFFFLSWHPYWQGLPTDGWSLCPAIGGWPIAGYVDVVVKRRKPVHMHSIATRLCTLGVPGYLPEYDHNNFGTRVPQSMTLNNQVWYPGSPRVWVPARYYLEVPGYLHEYGHSKCGTRVLGYPSTYPSMTTTSVVLGYRRVCTMGATGIPRVYTLGYPGTYPSTTMTSCVPRYPRICTMGVTGVPRVYTLGYPGTYPSMTITSCVPGYPHRVTG